MNCSQCGKELTINDTYWQFNKDGKEVERICKVCRPFEEVMKKYKKKKEKE